MSKYVLLVVAIVVVVLIFATKKSDRQDVQQVGVGLSPTENITQQVDARIATRNKVRTSILKRNAGRGEYSPDGSQIVFHAKGDDGYYDVYVVNSDGKTQERCLTCGLSQFDGRHAGQGSWHPNGQYITFQAEKPKHINVLGMQLSHPGVGWHNDIWILKIADSSLVQVTNLPVKTSIFDQTPYSAVLHPHFSKDGNKLSWAQTTENTINGWQGWKVVEADFSISTNVPMVSNIRYYQPRSINGYYESDDYNSDGNKLLLSGNLEPNQSALGMDIYEYDISNDKLTRFTSSLYGWDEAAIYSPDYSKIVWLSSEGYDSEASSVSTWWSSGKTDYWIMDANGDNKRQITFFNKPGTIDYSLVEGDRVMSAYIEWHPGGKQLVAGLIIDRGRNMTEDVLVLVELN